MMVCHPEGEARPRLVTQPSRHLRQAQASIRRRSLPGLGSLWHAGLRDPTCSFAIVQNLDQGVRSYDQDRVGLEIM